MRNSLSADAAAVRSDLGDTLDEVEARFHPGYIGGVALWAAKRSIRRHPVVWGVAGALAVTLAIGLVSWALLSDDDEV